MILTLLKKILMVFLGMVSIRLMQMKEKSFVFL